ncbi:HNH endonuclease [Limnothrix sp. FACHB-708]|uniref:HNH endonuclease n=1 Tax=unclassified Limnothrix TaxID=2632864 RepID=UPI0016835E34|nr:MULTISPECIES: HNH endonuclease [unclassified Limnothrix]MBD2552965.1 HNH endonuclease [Limnothrix sp. FACHB-708]MBD2589223.1 HNH endonuclease [Limnothrix sp. FACHB-406]
MWHWDQGRLNYFQFDALRQIAGFVQNNNFKTVSRDQLHNVTGLAFRAPETHSPWRNYARTLKLCLLVSEIDGIAQPTPVARILSRDGLVTCDEYFHFLISAFTEPSPASKKWSPDENFRYPLLFSLKYLLAKVAIGKESITSLDEIIGAYRESNFDGTESDEQFIAIMGADSLYEGYGKSVPSEIKRQAKESLKVISQISYLYIKDNEIIVTLNQEDAINIFQDLFAIPGPRANNKEAEIQRLASFFKDGSTNIVFDYPSTTIEEIVESGFIEGSKVKKTHVIIERNKRLRKEFFSIYPSPICDVCRLDTTKTYPWTTRILDLHHLLPLSSGTRVENHGTTFEDVVPVCPNCHRAIHRFYDTWLDENEKIDFKDTKEARDVYQRMKNRFTGWIAG